MTTSALLDRLSSLPPGLCLLGLGSNLGDRRGYIRSALEAMQQEAGPMLACSQLIETAPVEMTSPHAFLNAVAAFRTGLTPAQLLATTQDIERRLGRTRKSRGGQHFDRTIDLDILALGPVRLTDEEVLPGQRLTLPHPRIALRPFVLEPLAEVLEQLQ